MSMRVFHLATRSVTLALLAFLAMPAAVQAEALPAPGPIDTWPPAVAAYWRERAGETASINGVMWSVRVLQAGERQAEVAARNVRTTARPSPAELAEAYQAADAPLYIRLTDGAIAQTPEAAAAMDNPDCEVITGKPGSIRGTWVNFRAGKKNYLLAKVPRETLDRFTDDKSETTLLVKPGDTTEQTVRGVKQTVRTYTIVPIDVQTPTPEALRAWCRANNVTAFPDPRPVPQVHERTEKQRVLGGGTRGIPKSRDIRDVEVVVRTFTFTWSIHAMNVPSAAR